MEEKPIDAQGVAGVQPSIDQPEVESPTPVIEQKPRINKFVILGVILGVLVFAGAVFGAYKIGQKQIQFQPSPTPEAVVSPSPDPTADWETYTNTKYGYSIKYPQNYSLGSFGEEKPETLANIELKSPESTISIIWMTESPEYSVSLVDWYNNLSTVEIPYTSYGAQTSPDYTERKEIEIGGVKGIQLKQIGEHGDFADILLPLLNAVVEIGIDYDIIETPEIKQILSTFKFLEEGQVELKTYRNDKYNFEFQYPQKWELKESFSKTSAGNNWLFINLAREGNMPPPGTLPHIQISVVESTDLNDFSYDEWTDVIDDIVVDGFNAEIRQHKSADQKEAVFAREGKTFEIISMNYSKDNLQEGVFNQILSTFFFLD